MSQFPLLPDGDVVIVSVTGHMWKLHSAILSQFSPLFRDLLNEKSSGHTAKKQKADSKGVPRWKFKMLTKEMNDRWVNFVSIDPKDPNPLPGSLNGKGARPGFIQAYDNLFRCFYSLDPELHDEDREEQGVFTHHAIYLIQAAERVGSIGTVRRDVESYLLGLDQNLWKHLIAQPPCYADLAIRLQSPTIFKEAMVHVIGAWRLPGGMARLDLPKNDPYSKLVKAIAERKVAELDEIKKQIEAQILDFTPRFLIKRVTADGKKPGYPDYSSDIYKWQAFTMVKNFIAKSLWDNQGRLADDGGADFYRKLSTGAHAYLVPLDLKDWHQDFEMTPKGEGKVEEALRLVKETFKPLAAPLLVHNGIPLPSGAPPLPYLTCAVINEEDYPWNPKGKMVDIVEQICSEFGPFSSYEPLVRTRGSNTALYPATPSPDIPELAVRSGIPQTSGTQHSLAVPATEKHRSSTTTETHPASGDATSRQGRAKSHDTRLPSTLSSARPKRSAAEAFGDENNQEEKNGTSAVGPLSDEF